MRWAHTKSISIFTRYLCRLIDMKDYGFDTFEGFTNSVTDYDRISKEGDFVTDGYE